MRSILVVLSYICNCAAGRCCVKLSTEIEVRWCFASQWLLAQSNCSVKVTFELLKRVGALVPVWFAILQGEVRLCADDSVLVLQSRVVAVELLRQSAFWREV